MAASGVRYLYKDRLGSITVWTNSTNRYYEQYIGRAV